MQKKGESQKALISHPVLDTPKKEQETNAEKENGTHA
jgi:hypothetical protein